MIALVAYISRSARRPAPPSSARRTEEGGVHAQDLRQYRAFAPPRPPEHPSGRGPSRLLRRLLQPSRLEAAGLPRGSMVRRRGALLPAAGGDAATPPG